MRIKLVFIITLALVFLPACWSRAPRKVYFVRLGDFPAQTTERLIAHYKAKFNIAIETLPPIPLDATLMDRGRKQFVAESLITLMREKHPKFANDPGSIVIGLTREDIFIRSYDWQFAFNLREEKRLAVVSSARMDPVNFGEPANDALLNARLRKMVTKNIGVLYFGKSLNSNPRSVLYKYVDGVAELDGMTEEF